jgi:CHAD domain-containing protein
MAEVALANLRCYLSGWYLHEPGARLGDNPDELHDFRVAGRRMDAILRQFRSCLPASIVGIRPTLKKVLRVLGEVRDLDVALSESETFCRELPEKDRKSIEPLKQYLVSQRGRARTRMLSVLDSVSVQKDIQNLVSLASAPAAARQQLSRAAAASAPEMIRLRYRKVRKGADRLTPDSSTEAYHEVRGRVKKLRYVLEAVAVIYGKPANQMLRALRRWQEKLGVQQDAAVASHRLKALAGAPPKGMPSDTLFWMGRFAEHYARDAARARKQHAKGYRRVRGSWKSLRMKFEKSRAITAPAPPNSWS